MMVVLAILLGLVGLFLSSFFSGTETGFYRVSRIRVQLDAIEGHRLSQWLLHLINRPSLFIATILIGNNIANYLVSTAGVIFVQAVFVAAGDSAEILATLMLTPLLFVFGEMFPKYLFMQTPERMLKRILPLFFVFLVLLLPISLIIWLFNRGLSFLLGEKHEPLQTKFARRELTRRFDEGQEYGLILPSQRQLTRNVVTVATQSILYYMTPINDYPMIRFSASPQEMLAIAKKYELPEFPVFSDWNENLPVGYVRTIELALALTQADATSDMSKKDGDPKPEITAPVRELIEIDDDHSPLNAMLLFQAGGESLAIVVDEDDNILGLISEKRLMSVLFAGEKHAV